MEHKENEIISCKEQTNAQLEALASDLREQIIQATATYGGHLSSNLGVVEITIALHRAFDFPRDKLLFDVGHQCYTHKLLSGRSLDHLRQKDGCSGFQKREESDYDCFEAGHSSTSLSAALGMARARDLDGEKYEIIVIIGDGSIMSGEAFEALNDLSHRNHKVIIILNDNDMSISRPVGGTANLFSRIRLSLGYNKAKGRYQRFLSRTRLGYRFYRMTANMKNSFKRLVLPMTFFDNLGIDYIGPIDGHDFFALDKAFRKAKKISHPVVIHCHTVKGKGFELAEKDQTGFWHGVPPYDPESGRCLCQKNRPTWSRLYSDFVIEAMEQNPDIVYINPAMINGAEASDIMTAHPDRAYDVGIAEEHAISLASGLALAGKHPIVGIYSTFLQRAFDQVNQDLCRMNLSTTILIDRSGLVGADGETHQGLYDEAFLVSTPHMIVTMASEPHSAKELFLMSLESENPFAIRYPRGEVTKELDSPFEPVQFGRWRFLSATNSSTVVIGVGPLLWSLFDLLKAQNSPIDVVEAIFIKPLDEDCLRKIVEQYRHIIIYQPYATRYGLVQSILAFLLEHGYHGSIKTFVVPDEFVRQATIDQQLESFGLLPQQVYQAIGEGSDE